MYHARPHLETHKRDAAQSAVAGAAYRLGLKLYDRRLKRAFDFRKRSDGDQVVYQATLAPPGAPAWATDPGELWNRVEAAERRRDAQIARDYRIPLPLGLPDADVIAMAREIAEYLCHQLTTPVSIGVHRDGSLDAFGKPKPAEQVGCHAHLYLPTRRILLDDAAAEDERGGGTGMGDKLDFLSRSSTSRYFVDSLNAKWADAANRYAAKHGLAADFSHLSYRRMGLKLPTQPKLGAAATALERQSIGTQKGDRVREAKAMAEIYRATHAQRIARAAGQQGLKASGGPVAPAALATPREDLREERANDIHARAPKPAPTGNRQSLVERFKALYFAGMEEGARPEHTLVFRLVVAIEHALERLWGATRRHSEWRREHKGAVAQKLDAEAVLAEWHKADGEAAEDAAEATGRAGVLGRVTQGVHTWLNPPDPILVERAKKATREREAHLAAQVQVAANRLRDVEEQERPLRKEITEKRHAVRKSLKALSDAHEQALPQLLAAALDEERAWIERYMPELLGPGHAADPIVGGTGRFPPPAVTPRRPRGH